MTSDNNCQSQQRHVFGINNKINWDFAWDEKWASNNSPPTMQKKWQLLSVSQFTTSIPHESHIKLLFPIIFLFFSFQFSNHTTKYYTKCGIIGYMENIRHVLQISFHLNSILFTVLIFVHPYGYYHNKFIAQSLFPKKPSNSPKKRGKRKIITQPYLTSFIA